MQDEAHGRHRTHPNTQHITIRLREHLYTLCSHRQTTESKPKSAHDRMSRLSTDRAKKIHMRKPTPEPVQTILSNGRGHVVAHTARRAGTEVGKGWSCGLLCLGHGGGRESERTGRMHSTTKKTPNDCPRGLGRFRAGLLSRPVHSRPPRGLHVICTRAPNDPDPQKPPWITHPADGDTHSRSYTGARA